MPTLIRRSHLLRYALTLIFFIPAWGCKSGENGSLSFLDKDCEKYRRYHYFNLNPFKTIGYYDIEVFKNTPAWDIAKCVYEQDTLKLAELCRQNPKLANFQSTEIVDITLLQWAIMNNRYYSARTLLMNGANPNDVPSSMGSSLFAAAAYEYTSCYVRLLLAYNVNPNPKWNIAGNSDAETSPLQIAVISNDTNMQLLVEAGANVNYRAFYGATPITDAIQAHRYDNVLYLISKGAEYKHAWADSMKNYTLYLIDFLKIEAMKSKNENKVRDSLLEFLREHGADSTIGQYEYRSKKQSPGIGDMLQMRSIK